MADGLVTNPGSGGATIATDEIGSVHYPRTKIGTGADGEYQDVGPSNPMPIAGENIEGLLVEIALRLVDISDSVGNLMPDVAGRLRVAAETVANIATITTVTTVTTVSTVSAVTTVGSVTNQAQIGGLAANQQMIFLSQMNEAALRNNVVDS